MGAVGEDFTHPLLSQPDNDDVVYVVALSADRGRDHDVVEGEGVGDLEVDGVGQHGSGDAPAAGDGDMLLRGDALRCQRMLDVGIPDALRAGCRHGL